ncbi:hypothetical protein D5R81_19300 [Parashewanella spongiae]|uniref:Uncharacterized protein n=1 Tax=Parashewanella spongiae TaxID=342950 RepID=A0A3A6T376_9GAMM|nr:hypothetical protein [Parashewanella spongiae]MCL1080207.1 hypothetical protein [Parashewanella spongiae]RJY02337.1 hypothetical protein D5R81_19300 [Parashewanella spongiae]
MNDQQKLKIQSLRNRFCTQARYGVIEDAIEEFIKDYPESDLAIKLGNTVNKKAKNKIIVQQKQDLNPTASYNFPESLIIKMLK